VVRDRCVEKHPLCELLGIVMISSTAEKKAIDRASILKVSLLHRVLG
jgi:hypothetical protein